MTFSLQFELDYQRVISAVINDSRSVIPSLVGRDGNAVYAYAQAQIAQVVPGVLVYRIIGSGSNLCGYCLIQVQNGVATVLQVQPRPAFVPFLSQISQIINNFIIGNIFLQDMLY